MSNPSHIELVLAEEEAKVEKSSSDSVVPAKMDRRRTAARR
jgi:hypothetical protein